MTRASYGVSPPTAAGGCRKYVSPSARRAPRSPVLAAGVISCSGSYRLLSQQQWHGLVQQQHMACRIAAILSFSQHVQFQWTVKNSNFMSMSVSCRDLARQVLQWMTDPADAELAASACRLIRAFPIALMASLRTDHDLRRGEATDFHPACVAVQQPAWLVSMHAW